MATMKQQKAAELMVENGGNASRAMKDAGYSINTAKTPSKLTQSKAFREILDDEISDGYLVRILRSELDNSLNKKPYLELAFKLKGKLKNPKDVEQEHELAPILVKWAEMQERYSE